MRIGSELTINLGHLAYNFELIQKMTPSLETIFMVKANAYGHGILEIVSFAFHELGIKRFGCASLGEAIYVRQNLPNLNCELWVFSDTNLENAESRELYTELGITPVIHQLRDLKFVLSDKSFKYMPLVFKFDTGMHRLGITEDEVTEVINLLQASDRMSLLHVMTHFSSSYLKHKEGDRTHQQLIRFENILSMLRDHGVSIEEISSANSGAIEQGIATNFTHIRPGLMMYGGESFEWRGKCVSSLKTHVLKTFEVKKGMPVGYGGHVCAKDGHVVLLPLGYGDGILTSFSGLKFNFYGKDAQVLGRVNMDLTSIFFEELPSNLSQASEFVIWGEGIHNVNELAAQLKTIPYQLFTAISTRVPRRYIN